MRSIKFRAWDGERMRPVLTLGINEGFVCTSKVSGDIEDFEIMEFTGLHDKNGREIYEGDIVDTEVQTEGKVRAVVKLYEEVGAFVVEIDGGYYYIASKDTEVIGNIYENPELAE